MKRVLFILPGFNFGGTVFSTLNMISFLRNHYDITVLPMTYQGPVIKNYQEAGIALFPESIFLSAMMGKIGKENSLYRKVSFLALKLVRRLSSRLKIDFEHIIFREEAKRIEHIVHFDIVASCQEGGATYFASFFKNCKKVAWFRSEYSIYRTEYPQSVLDKDQIIYPQFDNVVCVSKTTRDDFAGYFSSIDGHVVSIHNIQNVDNIVAKANLHVEDFPNSPFVIVSVGRINPQKRFSSIPSIARKMLDAGCEFKWIILGDGNAFGEWDKLQSEIEGNEVGDTVLCLGSKLNPYPYILKANLLVNTSYVEACPRVVIEAKLLKTPVVCTDFSSAREFVTSGYDGFVDTIDNVHKPIIEMVKDSNLYDRIKTICNSYSIDNELIFDQLKSIFS